MKLFRLGFTVPHDKLYDVMSLLEAHDIQNIDFGIVKSVPANKHRPEPLRLPAPRTLQAKKAPVKKAASKVQAKGPKIPAQNDNFLERAIVSILQAKGEPMTFGEVRAALARRKLKPTSFYPAKESLVEKGLVVQDNRSIALKPKQQEADNDT